MSWSCALNFALGSWWIPALWLGTMAELRAGERPSWGHMAAWSIYALVSPACLGLLTGIAGRRGWVRTLAIRGLGFRIDPPIDTAWMFAFRGPGRPSQLWVRVTLKDGSVIDGRFGAASLASPRFRDRDLFLEDVYFPSPSGRPMRAVDSSGVWVTGSEIQTLEFRRVRMAREESFDAH